MVRSSLVLLFRSVVLQFSVPQFRSSFPTPMNNRLRQLLRLMAGYSLTSYIGPIFTVVLTPLYTRVLRPADYAQLDLLTTIAGLVGAFANLGLGHALSVNYYEGDDQHRRNLLTTAAVIGLIWAVLVALPLWPFAAGLATILLGGSQYAGLLLLVALGIPLTTLGLVTQTGLRLTMAVGRANLLALVNLLLTVALNIMLVLWLRQGVWGIQLTLVIAGLWVVLGGALLLGPNGWGRPTRRLVEPLVRAGLGALPGILALWALAYCDRLLLPLYGIPASERGLYAVAAKLASMLAIVIMPFQIAWAPLALAMRDDPNADHTYARVLLFFTAGALGLALAVALFAHEILQIFTTSAYLGAAPYVALLIYTTVANGITICVGVGAALQKRTDVTGISLLAGALLNLLLNALLIPQFGVWGAASATAIGYGIVPILVYMWSQRIRPIAYHPWRIVAILMAQVLLLVVGLNLPFEGWANIAARIGLLAAYPGLLLILRVVKLADVRALLLIVKR